MIDHGKAFLSAHVISVCTRLGISIQPAQPRKPTDKPTCERFFKTLREGLIRTSQPIRGRTSTAAASTWRTPRSCS